MNELGLQKHTVIRSSWAIAGAVYTDIKYRSLNHQMSQYRVSADDLAERNLAGKGGNLTLMATKIGVSGVAPVGFSKVRIGLIMALREC